MGVISGDYDQRVTILFSDSSARCTASSRSTVSPICPQDSQRDPVYRLTHLQLAGKSLLIFTQQFNGFVGHLRQGRYTSLRCGLGVQVTAGLSILPWSLLSVLASALAYCRQQTALIGFLLIRFRHRIQ